MGQSSGEYENDIRTVENFDGIMYPTNFPYPNGNPFGLTNEKLTSYGIHTTFTILGIAILPMCFIIVILLQLLGNQIYNNTMPIYEQIVMVFVRGFMSSIMGLLILSILFIIYKKYWEK